MNMLKHYREKAESLQGVIKGLEQEVEALKGDNAELASDIKTASLIIKESADYLNDNNLASIVNDSILHRNMNSFIESLSWDSASSKCLAEIQAQAIKDLIDSKLSHAMNDEGEYILSVIEDHMRSLTADKEA